MESITLASGQTLHKGQYIQLADKISDLFPELKGNVLPTRTYDFFQSEQATHFEYVDLFLYCTSELYFLEKELHNDPENSEHGQPFEYAESENDLFWVANMMGLLVDQIQYFELQNNIAYAYTHVFKIDIAKALAHQEITLLENDQCYSEKDIEDARVLVNEINEALGFQRLGMKRQEDTNKSILKSLRAYFVRRDKWRIKD